MVSLTPWVHVLRSTSVSPTGPQSALIVIRLEKHPFTSQQNRSPHRRDYWVSITEAARSEPTRATSMSRPQFAYLIEKLSTRAEGGHFTFHCKIANTRFYL